MNNIDYQQGAHEILSDPRQSVVWMDLVLNSISEGVAVADENLQVIFVNDAFTEMAGKERVTCLSKPFIEVFPILEGERAVTQEEVRVSGLKSGPYVLQSNSVPRSIEVESASIDRLRQTVFVIRDVTERHRAEEELLRMNKELETFSYSISHDLRAPLRTIDGFSKILAEEYADKLDEEGKRFLGNIRDGAQEMGKLIDDILTLSRFGRREIQPEHTDMHALCYDVWKTFSDVTAERNIKIDIRSMPPAFVDPSLIRQVWINLLSNAIKFTKEKETAVIIVSGVEKNDWVEYSVEDNGAGFDMRYADKMFGVFQRLHSTEEFEGTGVGLAIVSHIILRHGGKVRAEGKVNEGAKFFFSIPKAPEGTGNHIT